MNQQNKEEKGKRNIKQTKALKYLQIKDVINISISS